MRRVAISAILALSLLGTVGPVAVGADPVRTGLPARITCADGQTYDVIIKGRVAHLENSTRLSIATRLTVTIAETDSGAVLSQLPFPIGQGRLARQQGDLVTCSFTQVDAAAGTTTVTEAEAFFVPRGR